MQDSQGNEEKIWVAGGRLYAKRRQERVTLGFWQICDVVEDWQQELMQAGKWEMRLGLHSNGVQLADPAFARAFTRYGENRRFTNTCCATHEERRAAFIDVVDEMLKRLELAVATDEDHYVRSLLPSPLVRFTWLQLSRSVGASSIHRIVCATS
jgi:hypothetical protein